MPRKSSMKKKEELEGFDPYAFSADPEREEYRARVREGIMLGEQRWEYQMSKAREGEVGYAQAAANALAAYDDAIATSKR